MLINYIVATDQEYEYAKKYLSSPKNIIKTGVGVINVIRALKDIEFDDHQIYINAGFAGSDALPIGKVIRIGMSWSMQYPKAVKIKSPCQPSHLLVKRPDDAYACFTSDDFVENMPFVLNAAFDMELNYICAFNIPNLYSYKIISDNLNTEEYDLLLPSELKFCWEKLNDMIRKDFYEN